MDTDWEDRVTAAWATFEDYGEDEGPAFRAVIDALVAELPDGSPHGPFERACAWDTAGHSDRAVPLHREALDGGLAARRPYKARRARIRPASSLRNTGRAAEGVALPRPERDAPQDESDDAVRTVPAVGLSDLGRDREGLALVLEALAGHLPRYRRSLAAYAHGWSSPDGTRHPRPAGRDGTRSGDHPRVRSFCGMCSHRMSTSAPQPPRPPVRPSTSSRPRPPSSSTTRAWSGSPTWCCRPGGAG